MSEELKRSTEYALRIGAQTSAVETSARIERLVEKPDERFGWKVTRGNGWCVEVTFPSTPPGSIAQHLVVNCGDNERQAHQIARDCELAAKAWLRSALTEFAEGK